MTRWLAYHLVSPGRTLFWVGVTLVALAGIAAAFAGVWWAFGADIGIALGIVLVHHRAKRQWREGWWRPSNGHRELPDE